MTQPQLQYVGPEGWGDTAYPGDAGIDIPITTMQVLEPGEFYDLPSGVKVAIPEGYYGRIAARSGALRNRRIRVYEGVIDSGFRGELFTYCEAVGPTATAVRPGDRLAQLIISPVIRFPITRVDELPVSIRGTKGFGSSDQHAFDERAERSGVIPTVILDTSGTEVYAARSQSINIYLGGPIDYQDTNNLGIRAERMGILTSSWRSRNVRWYDPKVQCAGLSDPQAIVGKNSGALMESDIAVFLFPDPPNYGFGSPIEIDMAVHSGKKVVVWHNGDQVGVYLRELWQQGAIVATEWKDFIRVLGEEIAKVGNG